MKILAALKKIKHLDRKIEKAIKRIDKWCSVVQDNENDPKPVYDGTDLQKMHQQVTDWSSEKIRIRHALHLTNIRTKVEFNSKPRSIDELLLIQNILLPAELRALKALHRRTKGGYGHHSESKDSWVLLQYDPKDRDQKTEAIEFQLELLDELLDNVNIETDVVGLD
jgi:hypothetical protein